MSFNDIELLTKIRLEVLRAANNLSQNADMKKVEEETINYYKKNLLNENHITFLAYLETEIVGAGSISFYQVMPTYSNPSGKKAYIMNMFTYPKYRRNGVATKMLNCLIFESKKKGINFISLEATEQGQPLYEKYGFKLMKSEMEL